MHKVDLQGSCQEGEPLMEGRNTGMICFDERVKTDTRQQKEWNKKASLVVSTCAGPTELTKRKG